MMIMVYNIPTENRRSRAASTTMRGTWPRPVPSVTATATLSSVPTGARSPNADYPSYAYLSNPNGDVVDTSGDGNVFISYGNFRAN